ncbi:unnamed protein product [Trifolium pratense]|uniref:Uncharacterized protein n=1 Tax=Trifolium pratense TaxID=57577 RepID=A0ACB0IF86_TRIPR|nr:unnamed protein product [Trifolium pratense]
MKAYMIQLGIIPFPFAMTRKKRLVEQVEFTMTRGCSEVPAFAVNGTTGMQTIVNFILMIFWCIGFQSQQFLCIGFFTSEYGQ